LDKIMACERMCLSGLPAVATNIQTVLTTTCELQD